MIAFLAYFTFLLATFLLSTAEPTSSTSAFCPASMVLTEAQKRDFIRDGYLILRNVVPQDKLQTAREHTNRAYRQQKFVFKNEATWAPNFLPEVQKQPELSELPRDNLVQEALEDLLGKGNPRWGRSAQIAFRLKEQYLIDRGVKITDTMPRHKYHVDGGEGRYRTNGTAFAILLGVPLSGGQMHDENRGQLNVWPGSHLTMHEIIKQRVKEGLVDGANTLYGGDGRNKPDIGQPVRVLLRPGDVVLAHQRLGHSGGWNLSDNVRKNLYFRVRHRRHEELLEEQWSGSLWTEFEGLHHLVGYEPPA